MYKSYWFYFLSFIIAVSLLCSCSTAKKAQSTKEALIAIDSQLVQSKHDLSRLDEQRKNKQSKNEIDDTASNRIQKYISKTKNEIDTAIKENTLLIGETVVAREDWNKLKDALLKSQKSLKSIQDKTSFINDLLKRNTVVKLDQDVIFKPGEYEVSPAVAEAIGKFFEPAALGVDSFISKYPDFSLSLVITAKGYADGTTIATDSKLYKELKDQLKLQTETPTSKDLNNQLSRLRAKKVIELFQDFTNARSGKRKLSNEHILYLFEGKGETFPDPSISNYKIDDPRRRVVLLFWSIFPE